MIGKSDDPWSDILISPSGSRLNGRLVAESRPWEMFRALDHLGRRVLFLVHARSSADGTALPRIAGLDVETRVREDDDRLVISVTLESADDADIFTRLSDDVIETVASAGDERTAVQAFIGRMWKWHALLRGARKQALSREAQLGLIGELWTIQNVIARHRGLSAAISGWRGTQLAPKDFELSNICIECKARGAASRNKVRITSEHQLADVPGHDVILLVHTFASAEQDDIGAVDLHRIVEQIRSGITMEAPQLSRTFETALEDAGYDETHEYDVIVVHRAFDAYRVANGFPRIVPGSYPDGPIEVAYDLPLADLASFQIGQRDFTDLLLGED